MLRAISARIDRLTDYPRLGPRRSDISPATPMLVEGPYLVLYETHPDTDEGPVDEIEIVRVVDGRRDLTGLF
jgi:toxin ParE1/3/4